MESELARLRSSIARTPGASPRADALLSGIVEQPFSVAGKRLRPLLVLLAARASAGLDARDAGDGRADMDTRVALAAAVELLHSASLVHDDVIDEAATRRQQASLNRRFGNPVAVLAGDMLYTAFFSRLLGLSRLPVERRVAILEMFLATTNAMCVGEILAQAAGSRPLCGEEYREIATNKTASLFSACCRAGAFVSGADASTVETLAEFGLRFGLLFQIADDLADCDVSLAPGLDLYALAEANAEAAQACLARLDDSRFRDALRGLIDSVAAGARAPA